MKTRRLIPALLLTLFTSYNISSQSVEIQGEAKVTEMTNDNEIDEIVVRKPDGTLATRSAQSLPSSFEDTIRSLNTDFELAKHICDCGTDLPPYLIESLLDAGYSAQDLIKAGVPFSNLSENVPVIDIDGNEYDVITIGTQKWLKQNLRVTKYNDGTPIDLKLSNTDWTQAINAKSPAYTYPNGTSANVDEYGLIYSSYTVLSDFNGNKELCPSGWTVPKNSDFSTLIEYLDPGSGTYNNSAGIYLKSTGTSQWNTPNIGANNLTEFSGKPSGGRWQSGNYVFFGSRLIVNTKDPNGPTAILYYRLEHDETYLRQNASGIELGASAIRCIKE